MTAVQQNLSRIYLREKDIVSREIAGETILVPIRGNLADMQHIFTLNPVGAYIWELLDGDNNLSHILDKLLEDFDTSPDQAEADIIDFLDQVTEAGLVVEKD
jgi:hypothetical protein